MTFPNVRFVAGLTTLRPYLKQADATQVAKNMSIQFQTQHRAFYHEESNGWFVHNVSGATIYDAYGVVPASIQLERSRRGLTFGS